jgi:hypothetical protein
VASTPDVSPQERHALRRAPGAVYTLGILGDGSGRMEEEARQRRVDAVAEKAAGQCRRNGVFEEQPDVPACLEEWQHIVAPSGFVEVEG